MIKIDTKTLIKKVLKDEPFKNLEGGDLTVGEVICNVLSKRVTNPTLGYQLAKKFAQEESVELKAEELIFIKKELELDAKREDGYFAVISGQVIQMLEK